MKLKEAIRKLFGLSNPKRPTTSNAEAVELRGQVPECVEPSVFVRAYTRARGPSEMHFDEVRVDELNRMVRERLRERIRRRAHIRRHDNAATDLGVISVSTPERDGSREQARVAFEEMRRRYGRRNPQLGALTFDEYQARFIKDVRKLYTCFICGKNCITEDEAINDAVLLKKYTGRETGILCCDCFRVAKVIIDGVTDQEDE